MPGFDAEWHDGLVFSKMTETKIPSVALAVIEDGEVVHSKGHGFRDVAGALLATPGTLYGIGSTSKSFVDLAIARLVEAGKLEFHDPVTKFLPLKQEAFEGVELHHLLSHSSGLPGLGSLEVALFQTFGEHHPWLPISSQSDMNSFLSDVDGWKEAAPGEKFFYLNEGFVLLGEIISHVSGRAWDRYLAEEIFAPLEMRRTFLQRADIAADPSALRAVKTETLMKRLEGEYKAYKDTIYAEVKRNGSFLMLSGEDIGKDIVLVPEGEDRDGARLFTLVRGARMEVTFRFNEHGVELVFERYRYRRAGPMPPLRESQWQS